MVTFIDQSEFSVHEQPIKITPRNVISISCIWDLAPGDHSRGHTITAVQGVVGLAHSPVAVLFLSRNDRPVKISATHSDSVQHSDEVTLRARGWIRGHGLREGDDIDIREIRLAALNSSSR